MRSILLPGVLLAGLGLLGGCGGSDDAPEAVTLELATWWSGASETSALDALLAAHREKPPGRHDQDRQAHGSTHPTDDDDEPVHRR